MVAHFTKKRLAGEVDSSLFQYVFIDYPGRSFSALISFLAAEAAALMLGGLDQASKTVLIATAFTTGYTLDSLTNKGFPGVPGVPPPQ